MVRCVSTDLPANAVRNRSGLPSASGRSSTGSSTSSKAVEFAAGKGGSSSKASDFVGGKGGGIGSSNSSSSGRGGGGQEGGGHQGGRLSRDGAGPASPCGGNAKRRLRSAGERKIKKGGGETMAVAVVVVVA